MFWVVDSLIMKKYKQKDTVDINGSIETPHARRTEESQVRPKCLRPNCKLVIRSVCFTLQRNIMLPRPRVMLHECG